MTQLFGLAGLSTLGIAMAFMVMTMTSELESRTKSDLGIYYSANAASNRVVTEAIGENALQGDLTPENSSAWR